MSDKRILYKFLEHELTNEHPAIYLYCVGKQKSQKTALNNAVKSVNTLFCPPYTVEFIIKTVTNFLEYKKSEYEKGNIIIIPIYR